jgi:NAD(P)-dependent dehydrogenase (short-subunit alcohol dehydrogenase family)
VRIALVQGASRGLGLAFAEALLREGACDRVIATSRDPDASEGLDALAAEHGDALLRLPLDVTDEKSIARVAERAAAEHDRLHWLLNCAGVLHDPELDMAPEKRLEQVRPESLRRAFEVNAFGPLLVARHFLPLLRHDERSVLANVSARVGSIGDDRLGGWYAYRGSKAAQNLFTRNLAIELRRRAPRCICVALHPGTVDTELSKPFQRNVPADRLFRPADAARNLLRVMERLGPEDSGGFFAWDGQPIRW